MAALSAHFQGADMSMKRMSIGTHRRGLGRISTCGALAVVLCAGVASAQAAPASKQAAKKTVQKQATPAQQSTNTPGISKIDLARQLIEAADPGDLTNSAWLPGAPSDADYRPVQGSMANLGKLLFHDKILSGNRNIACATCHNIYTDTSDGLSLPIGEGAMGLGPMRDTGYGKDAVPERVPRNAPQIFNIGAYDFDKMMHDGRIAADPNHPLGFDTPAGMDLIEGLDSVIAAQVCFPPTSGTEMAGQPGENSVANAAADGDLPLVWAILAKRVAANNEYFEMMAEVYDDVSSPQDITFAHIANAIAAFESKIARSDNAPFDQFMRGDSGAMSMNAVQGMLLFYGKANCSSCHSGPFMSNQEFHAIGMPQIGPGKGHNQPGYDDGHDDLGLYGETGNPDDMFKFRVPSLRNIALSAPYGHNGAFATLEAVVRHHLNPVESLLNYDPSQAVLPYREDLAEIDTVVMNDPARVIGILAANELGATQLSEDEISDLLDFLNALTDTAMIDLRHAIPDRVPSGLPVFD